MRIGLLLAVAVISMIVSGCGGASDSPIGGTPPVPPPAPTPPPAPPPAPAPLPGSVPDQTNPTLTDLRNTQTFATSSVSLQYVRPTTRPGDVLRSISPTIGTVFAINATNQNFVFSNQNTLPTTSSDPRSFIFSFTPDTQSTSSNARFNIFTTSSVFVTGGNGDNVSLRLFRPGTGNDLLALTHASIGIFEFSQGQGSVGSFNDARPFAFFSQTTPAAGMPQAGMITYSGVIVGFANPIMISQSGFGNVYDISGTIRVTIDFASRTYSGMITLTGTNQRQSTGVVNLGTFPLTQDGPASLSTLSGLINGGSFRGMLGGPNAQELAGTFILDIEDPAPNGLRLRLVAAAAAKQ
jgi:hypothetical protein